MNIVFRIIVCGFIIGFCFVWMSTYSSKDVTNKVSLDDINDMSSMLLAMVPFDFVFLLGCWTLADKLLNAFSH